MGIKDRNIEDLPLVCVMGLGFVGSAMAAAVAASRDLNGRPQFKVIGVDLPNLEGQKRIQSINEGRFPFESSDEKLFQATKTAYDSGLLSATSDEAIYEEASIVLVDVNCDVKDINSNPRLDMVGFQKAITTLGERMKPGSLVIVETTVPPGTCEKIAAPILKDTLKKRNLDENSIMLAHSYERVMPGIDYYDSIVNFWRVYAGHTSQAAEACHSFLTKVINTKDFPITRLATTTASETSKVLENSYRAVNIAFIEEWGRFAEEAGVDLFEVLSAIRMRPTHSNIRQPGFGVGGYCLTKDPLFTQLAAKEIFNRPHLEFPFSTQAININNKMPLVSLEKIEKKLGTLKNKRILLMGVSYRQDVGDTRHSPSEIFAKEANKKGALLDYHDSLVTHWSEMNSRVHSKLPEASNYDAIVFAVQHGQYLKINFADWFKESKPFVFDSNNVLSSSQRQAIKALGCPIGQIGRGENS